MTTDTKPTPSTIFTTAKNAASWQVARAARLGMRAMQRLGLLDWSGYDVVTDYLEAEPAPDWPGAWKAFGIVRRGEDVLGPVFAKLDADRARYAQAVGRCITCNRVLPGRGAAPGNPT